MKRDRFCDRIRIVALCAAAVGLSGACNENPVDSLSSRAAVGAQGTVFSAAQQQLDVLWVVDNSGSMCQEQRFLGANFDKFINEISDATLDFHIGVTTTHVPAGSYTLEPVARAGQLQSRPQPVPTPNPACMGSMSDGFKPVRETMAVAVSCMKTPDQALVAWSDEQIDCALRDSPDNTCAGVADRDGNSKITRADLFPRADEYRALPKFLKSSDYRASNGALDVARLRADFACMALVGTLGTGYEKGLEAAILAVSPDLTGLAAGAEGADVARPNHGFIRPDAGLSVIFVTDENDCSNDGSIKEVGGACGADACDYWNSPELADSSPLLKPEVFKQRFMEALSATKGRQVSEGEVIMAGIFGRWSPYQGAYPSCDGANNPAVPVACLDLTDENRPVNATSGDRYERSIRQFTNYFPNQNTSQDPLNFDLKEQGWMCLGDFSPALTQIGKWRPNRVSCIQDELVACASDADCKSAPLGGQAGRCLSLGQTSFCDTNLRLEARRVPGAQAAVEDIRDQELCQAGTIGALPGEGRNLDPGSCVISPQAYRWEACPAGRGIALVWEGGEPQAASKLSGYDVSVRYVVSVGDEETTPVQ